jgi:hypothetical protein
MARYWVRGGTYRDTRFREFADGETEIREGPFASYALALEAWEKLSWKSVDSCNTRFVIECETGADPASA